MIWLNLLRGLTKFIFLIPRVQWCAILMQHSLHKPYVNEVTLTRQNLSLKRLYSLGKRLSQQMRFRSFKRGTVSLCMSKGCKITSFQSWRSEKNPATRPTSHHTRATRVWFPDDKIILQIWQLVVLKLVDLQRPAVPL